MLAPIEKDVCMVPIAPGEVWSTETFSVRWMSKNMRITFQIVCANLLQTSNDSAMRSRQASLVYHLFDTNTSLNFDHNIHKDIFYSALDKKGVSPLPYAQIISSILADILIVPPIGFHILPNPLG